MGRPGLRVAVLTSSRADYGIYRPLLRTLLEDKAFSVYPVVFGTHLSPRHGHTIYEIISDGFSCRYTISTVPAGDKPEDISASIGKTVLKFSKFWKETGSAFDLVFSLGDRYEMFAAASASVPFNIPLAHIHGGETTRGTIDNIFRHSISLIAKYHFVATAACAGRVKSLKESDENVFVVGALGLDNIRVLRLLSRRDFFKKYDIDLNIPTLLVTFHPETVEFEKNREYTGELIRALDTMDYQIVITMPNADTFGNTVRKMLNVFIRSKQNVYGIESFGTQGYFSCLKHCVCMVGNSSSGIIEAASFGKYVINIGNRQDGREAGKNVLHCPANAKRIIAKVNETIALPHPGFNNIYGDGRTAKRMVQILKSLKIG